MRITQQQTGAAQSRYRPYASHQTAHQNHQHDEQHNQVMTKQQQVTRHLGKSSYQGNELPLSPDIILFCHLLVHL